MTQKTQAPEFLWGGWQIPDHYASGARSRTREQAPGRRWLRKGTKCQETCQERGAASAVTRRASARACLPPAAAAPRGWGRAVQTSWRRPSPRSRVPGAGSQEPCPRSRAPAARALSPKRLGFTERHQNSRVCAGPLTACQGFEWAGVVGCWSRLLRLEPTPGKGGREQLRGGGGESAKSRRPPPAHTSGSGAEASAAPGRPLPARRCPDLVWGSLGC